jgi:hypothetical protein
MSQQLLREFYELCEGGVCQDLLTEEEKHFVKSGGMILSGKIQEADVKNGNGRKYPEKILRREVEKYQQLVSENRALGECVDGETEILTANGWKYIKDIADDEAVFTLNTDTLQLEKEIISRKVVLDYKGVMYHIYNKSSIDMMLTPNHNMLVANRNGALFSILAENFVDGFKNNLNDIRHCSIKRGNQTWVGNDISTFKVGNTELDSEYFMAFLGIWLAEGWTIKTKEVVQLCQVKENITNEIRDMLVSLGLNFNENKSSYGKTVFTLNNKDLYHYLSLLGKSYNKYIPDEVKNLSPRLLNILFNWMLKGDGRNRKKRLKKGEIEAQLHRELYTTSERLANDTSEIIFKLGASATINTRVQKDRVIEGRQIKAENSRLLYIVSEGVAANAYLDKRFTKIDEIEYDGKVYCVTTGNGTWLMRRNGKIAWTRNCDHPESSVINLKNVSHMITKIWWDGPAVMAKLKILPTPSGQVIKSLVESGVKLGISSRGLGSTHQSNGVTMVDDDFQLICFDMVSEPSTPGAFMMKEAKDRLIKNEKVKRLTEMLNKIVDG